MSWKAGGRKHGLPGRLYVDRASIYRCEGEASLAEPLAGSSDRESANRFLEGKYLRAFHRQFARAAASPVDVPCGVQGDWTVAGEGKRCQLDRQHEALSRVRRKVIVRTLRNGRVQLVYRGKQLKWRTLPAGSLRKQPPAKEARRASGQPIRS